MENTDTEPNWQLGDVCEVQMGFTARSRLKKVRDGWRVVQLSDVSPSRRVHAVDVDGVDIDEPAPAHRLRDGDVVFRSGGTSNVANDVVLGNDEVLAVAAPLMILRPDPTLDVQSDAQVGQMKKDWMAFSELRKSVQRRYQEIVDIREYEPKIQKLLDDHVVAMPAETIIEIVNINDPDALKAVVDETGPSDTSKADRIASATRRVITERIEADLAFYATFSRMLKETIEAYRARRLSEKDYLSSVVDLASKVAKKDHGRAFPSSLSGDEDGQAFYGILDGNLKTGDGSSLDPDKTAEVAAELVQLIKGHLIVCVWSNEVAQNNMRNAIDDDFFDVLRDERAVALPMEEIDELDLGIMNLARARFRE